MHRWKLSALAAAALVSVSLTATDAWALALGRISMQSALGEPLRAEVELPEITAAEADSLQANVATPAVFRAQGMEYSATASQLKVQLHRRPDGSAVLRLSSAQPINEPFVDLVLNASWGAGQVVRSYTLLLDPPALRRPAPGVTAAPQAAMPAAPATAAPAAAAAPAPARSASAAAPAAQRGAAPSAPTAAAQTVRIGDTAGRLASAHRPAGVSLDQMLVAMLRANPHAFISGNVNRIKAGAVLQMPDQAAAQATPVSEARKIVAAQSHDFNQYRRQLAGAAPMATVETAKRSASGNVEAQVEDKKPSTAAPDKLTLSKGALEASKNADERLAQDKQAQSQSERLAELSRNLTELQQVSGAAATTAAGTAAAGASATAAAETGLTASAAAAPADTKPAVESPAAPAAEAPAPAAAPAAALASATQAPPAAAPAPAQESSFMDFLGEDPIRPLAGAGLLALLLGYAGYRVAQRRRQQRDHLLGDSQLPSDSFFGAGGGQRVDTAHSQFGSGTSMAYSPSQLDTGGEVDAVAEADVYLAYGRDLQAEEILKEALRSQPDRIAVHQKLADIYAKRQDRKAFEAVAQTVQTLTQGQGADWRHLAEQGRQLDPGNPLYQGDGQATPGADSVFPSTQPIADAAALAPVAMAAAAGAAAAGAAAAGVAGALAASALHDTPAELPPGLDLDLDLDLPGGLVDQVAAATAPQSLATHSPQDIDFEAIEPTWKLPAATEVQAKAEPVKLDPEFPALSTELPELPAAAAEDMSEDIPEDQPADACVAEPAADAPWSGESMEFSLESDTAPTPEPAAPEPVSAPAKAFESLEFDLSELSLDLGDTPPASLSQSSQAAAEDPLATKLALAQEFAAIGDSEGARTLIEEVVEEAHGELKARAQRLLSEID